MASADLDLRTAAALQARKRHVACAEQASHMLEKELRAAEELASQRAAAERCSQALRTLVEEVLDEASQWRSESSQLWTQQLHKLVLQARARDEIANITVTPLQGDAIGDRSVLEQRPSTHGVVQKSGGPLAEQAELILDGEKAEKAEQALILQVQLLRDENKKLAAAARVASATLNRGGGQNGLAADEAEAARRAALSGAREVQYLEQENARLRARVGKRESHQRRLEQLLLAQSRQLASIGTSGDVASDELRMLSLQGAARRQRLEAQSRVAHSRETGSAACKQPTCSTSCHAASTLRHGQGGRRVCNSRLRQHIRREASGAKLANAEGKHTAESTQDSVRQWAGESDVPHETSDVGEFNLSALETFVADIEASLSRSSLADSRGHNSSHQL